MLILEARVRGRAVRWPVDGNRLVVGRSPECQIVVDDDSISRRHFSISIEGGLPAIADLGSRNGIYLGGERLERFEVALGTIFAAGAVLFALREGITLTAPPSWQEGVAPLAALPEGRSKPDDDSLAAALDAADPAGDLTDTLLDFLVAALGLEAAAIVERHGSGWAVAAHSGGPLPIEPGGGQIEGLPVLGPAEPKLWLVARPWTDALAASPAMRLVSSLLRWTVGRAPESAVVPDAAPPETPSGTPVFVTASPVCRALLDELDRLAPTGLPILLLGESGTGKEVLARRLHARSGRAGGPFVALNCAALPGELLEAELFGIEKGVATGVAPRPGRFALASGGTLFLDEIGDLPRQLQPKLLRALEENEISPLGAAVPVRTDVRIVAATNHDPASAAGAPLRVDILQRLSGAVLRLPPLRERPEDILPLARHFARQAARSQGRAFRGIDVAAARTLAGYSWPGNARELRHVVARALALADGPFLTPELLPGSVTGASDARRGDMALGLRHDWRTARACFDRVYFAALLDRCGGNLSEAARAAGLSRSNLYAKLQELDLR